MINFFVEPFFSIISIAKLCRLSVKACGVAKLNG